MDRTDSGRDKLVVIKEYAKSIFFALLIALVIRALVIQPFKIPSSSMEDTLLVGDHLLIGKFIFGIKLPFADSRILKVRDPKRGDVIVFAYPNDTGKDFIKRVIGVPGDAIEIKDKRVYVNGRPYEDSHEVHREKDVIPGGLGRRDNFGPVKVPANAYFVMGDNRDLSYDSRFWGFVDDKYIEGLAFIKYWSWDKERSRVRWERIGKLIE